MGKKLLMLISLLVISCDYQERIDESGDSRVIFYCDPETKVEYVVYGFGCDGKGITPRLKADGSLYIKED